MMNTVFAIGARKAVSIAAIGSGLIAFCATTYAQTLEEIIVTAQRREQNLQNVPIAVSAFTSEALEARGVTDLNSLSNLAPNVNLDAGSPFSGDTSVLSASIRGIGQDDFAFNLDPGVGVYVDGVFLARTIGANQNLLDVERIEILKGPQGTLFGRNTIGGAINIVTHTPGDEFLFEGQATVGSYDRRDFAFTADLPISRTLLSSITVSSLVREGYQRTIPFPSTVPFTVDPQNAYPKAGIATSDRHGGQNQQVVRGKLLWNASETVRVTLAADWQHQDQSATPATVLSVVTEDPNANVFGNLYNLCISTPQSVIDTALPPVFNTTDGVCGPRATGTGLAPGGAALGGAGYVNGPGGNLLLSPNPRIHWNLANTQTGDIDKTYATGPSFAKNDVLGVALTADWDLNGLQFKSITGFRQIDWDVGIDLDGLPETILEVTDEQQQEQISQEFQLNGSAFDDRLNYVVGLYYFAEKGFVHDFVPFEGLLMIFDFQNDIDTKSYAGYFHTDFELTDTVSLTLGGRISREEKEFEGGQADLNGFAYKITGCNPPSDPAFLHLDPTIPPGVTCQQALGFPVPEQPLRYFPTGVNEQSWDVFTPKVGVQWQVTPDVMTYVSWSKGFKSGGWTTRLSQPIASGTQAEFDPEFAKTTELGVKSELFGRTMLLNAAVFYTEYEGIQLNVQQGPSPVFQNAGDATIKGAEVEMQALFGGVSFTFAGGYLDAEYDFVNPDTLIPATAELPKTPEWKLNFGPNYDFGLPNGASLRLSADYTRTDAVFNDSLNTPQLRRPATTALGAAIRYLSPEGDYEVVLGGTNLTDDRWLTTGNINLAAGLGALGTYNRPREWYLTVRVNVGS